MAQRRMFSNRIIGSARFMKMPVSSQALYFHLNINADDDGVVEAYQILRATGCNEDDLKVLCSKNLVKVLNEDLVSFIMDWREHNLIRADRKIDSLYKDLLLQIVPEADLIEPKPRADTGVVTRQITGRPLDGIGKVSIGKDRLDKDSIDTSNEQVVAGIDINSIMELFKEVNPSYTRLYSNKTERAALERLIKQYGEQEVKKMIAFLPTINMEQYAPTVTTPYQLEMNMGKIQVFLHKKGNQKQMLIEL